MVFARSINTLVVLCSLVLLNPVVVLAQEWDPFGGAQSTRDEDALDAELSGLIYSRWNSDIRNDLNGEQLHEWLSKALLGVELLGKRKNYRWGLNLSGLATYELRPRNDRVKAKFQPSLWDAYAHWESSQWDLSVGQQIRRWGRGVPSLVDVINPADFSEAIFIEDEFQKLPIPMARWTRYWQKTELELIAIPFYRQTRMPGNDSDWAPIAIRDLDGAQDIPIAESAIEQNLSPGIVTTPKDDFVSGDLGIRWTTYAQGMDIDIFLFYGNEDLPAPVFTGDFVRFLQSEQARGLSILQTLRSLSFQEIAAFSPIYVQQPERQLMAAAAIAMPLEKATARIELVGFSRQSIYDASLKRLRVPTLQALVGVDALSGDRFIWSLSFLGNALFTSKDLFMIRRFNVSSVGIMRVRPGDINLWIEARSIWNLNLGDAFVGPSLLYELASGLQAQAGVNLLLGTGSTPFGQFDNDDFLWFRLRYAF